MSEDVFEPLSWSRYAGYRPRWVVEGELAVSPMPRPEDLEEIASRYRTVVSLATPSEFVYGGHLDPRLLREAVRRHIWLTVGEYNAPTLAALARALEEAEETPLLVHCLRGCGRSPLYAAAWLSRRGTPLPEALTTVRERNGCTIETLPQRSVLEAYDILRRAGLLDAAREGDDPALEYAALMARHLSWAAGLDPVEAAAESVRGRRLFYPAARRLAEAVGYSLAGLGVEKEGGATVAVFTVWIPRGAHPASVPRPPRVPEGLGEELEELLGSAGVKTSVRIRVLAPREVPWV